MIYKSDSALISTAKKYANMFGNKYKVIFGVIADSDFLPNPEWQLALLRENQVQAVAMDGVPITKLGWLFKTPTIVFHCIANIAGQPIKDADTELAANNMNQLVVKFIGGLPMATKNLN
jgi:nucleoside phosphorylase